MSENWKLKAKCVKGRVDPDYFFPIAPAGKSNKGNLEERQAEAAKYCHGLGKTGPACPVRLECLEYALSTRQDDGVWGGTTESERVNIRKQRRKTA